MHKLYLPIIAAIISAFGQVLLKYAMLKHGPIVPSISGVFSLLLEPRLLAALSMYAAAMVLWLQVLAKIPLSVAYPMLAVTYAIVPLLASVFFKERIGVYHICGIGLVLLGVAIIGFSHE